MAKKFKDLKDLTPETEMGDWLPSEEVAGKFELCWPKPRVSYYVEGRGHVEVDLRTISLDQAKSAFEAGALFIKKVGFDSAQPPVEDIVVGYTSAPFDSTQGTPLSDQPQENESSE
jgi:hypothetical protein